MESTQPTPLQTRLYGDVWHVPGIVLGGGGTGGTGGTTSRFRVVANVPSDGVVFEQAKTPPPTKAAPRITSPNWAKALWLIPRNKPTESSNSIVFRIAKFHSNSIIYFGKTKVTSAFDSN